MSFLVIALIVIFLFCIGLCIYMELKCRKFEKQNKALNVDKEVIESLIGKRTDPTRSCFEGSMSEREMDLARYGGQIK